MLHHIQPLLASVWSVVGQYRLAVTNTNSTLCIGCPKQISDAIFDSIDPNLCGMEVSSQILAIAHENQLIETAKIGMLI